MWINRSVHDSHLSKRGDSNTKQKVDFRSLPRLLTLEQVSEILQVHANTLRNWDNTGKLKAIRIGPRRDRRYEREMVEKMYREIHASLASSSKKSRHEEHNYVLRPSFSWRTIRLFFISKRFSVFVYSAVLVAVGFAVVHIAFFARIYHLQAEEKKPQLFSYQLEPAQATGWEGATQAQHIDLLTGAPAKEFTKQNSAVFLNKPVTEAAGEITADLDLADTGPLFSVSDFSLPEDAPHGGIVKKADIVFSLAVNSFDANDDVIVLSYTIDGSNWLNLDSISLDGNFSNATHGGFWSYPLDLTTFTADSIAKLQVRVRYEAVPGTQTAVAYLDGVALVAYIQEPESVVEQIEQSVEVVKEDFTPDEEPTVSIAVEDKKMLGLGTEKRTIKEIHVIDPVGQEVEQKNLNVENKKDGGTTLAEYSVDTSEFNKPGLYTVSITIEQDGQTKTVTRDFTWGVLVINTMKPAYRPGESAMFGMGVLDSGGNTICDADLVLTITAPDKTTKILTTEAGTIGRSKECGPNTVTNVPDYNAEYTPSKTGDYQLELTATTVAGNYTITDTLRVQDKIIFDITRLGPTRIWPGANYQMFLEVTPESDYVGTFEDMVPSSFQIPSVENDGLVSQVDDNTKAISWIVDWKAGQSYTLSYEMDPPNISPELFLLGPAKAGMFTETRQWQIASDAACSAAATGNWSVGANWSGCTGVGGVPAATDTITLSNKGTGYTITADVDATVAGITLGGVAGANGITINNGVTLTNTGTTTFNAQTAATNATLAVGAAKSYSTTAISISGGATAGYNSVLSLSTGQIDVSGAITCATIYTAQQQITFTSSGTINVGGNFAAGTNACTLAGSTGKVNLNGGSAQVLGNYTTYYNVDSSNTSGGVTLEGTTTIGGALAIKAGTFTVGAYNLTVTGTTTVSNNTTLAISSATGTKRFTGAVTINSGGTWNNSGNSAINFRGGLTNNSSQSHTWGSGVYTFDTNDQNIGGTNAISIPSVTSGTAAKTLTNTGTLTITTALAGGGNFTNTGNLHLDFTGAMTLSGTFTASADGNLVDYGYAGAQTVKAVTYHDLTLSSSGDKTLTSVSTIDGNLTLSDTATATTAAAFAIGGNLDVGTGTTFTAAGYNLTVTGTTGVTGTLAISSATGTKQFTGAVTINSGGTWNNSGNSAINFRGGLTNNSANAHTFGSGVQTFDTNDQAIGGTNAISIPSVTVTDFTLTNNGTLTVTTALAGNGGLTNGATGTLNINFTGAVGITTMTASASGNTVNYGYAGAQTVRAVTYHHLTLSGSGAKTVTSVATVNGNLTMSGSATATTNALATVGGNIVLSDTSTLTLGTVALVTVTGDLTVGTGTTLTVGVSTTINGGDITVTSTGALASSGTPTVTMGATGAISGNGNITIYNLATSGTGTTTFSASGTNLITNNVTVGAGTTLAVATSMTVNGGAGGGVTANGAFNVSTGTINIGNGTDEDLSVPAGGSTNLSGGTINIKDDLLVTGGDATIATTVNVNGNTTGSVITVSSGTFTIDTGAVVQFSGTWTVSGGTAHLNGGSISGTTTTSSNITWGGTSEVDLDGADVYTGPNAVVILSQTAGTLTFNMTAGNIYCRAWNLYGTGTLNTATVTGGTIHLGRGGVQSATSFYDVQNNAHSFYNIQIDDDAKIHDGTTKTIPIKGTFTISSGQNFDSNTDNTMQVDGGWVNNGGTFTAAGTSTVILRGGNVSGTADTAFNNLTIGDGTTTATVTVNGTDDPTVAGTLTVDAGDILSIGAGRIVSSTGAADVAGTGTISGSGILRFTNTSGGPGTDPVISAPVQFDASSGDIAYTTFDARTYGGAVTIEATTGTSRTVSFASGTYNFSSTLSFGSLDNCDLNLTGETYNPQVNITGDFSFGSPVGRPTITTGTGVWKISGNINFTNGTYTATAGNTLKMDGAAGQITSNNTALKNFESASISGYIQIVDALNVDGTFHLTSGEFRQGADVDMSVAGNFTIDSGKFFTKSSGSGKLVFDGDLNFADNTSPQQDLGVVEIGTSPDTTTLTSNLTASSLAVKPSDILNTDGYDLDIGTGGITIDGTLNATRGAGGTTLIYTEGSWALNTGGTFTADNSAVTFDGASANLAGTAATTFYDLTIASNVTNTASNHSVTHTLTVNASKTLTINSGRILTLNSTGSLTLNNIITGAGTFTYKPSAAFPTSGTISSVLRFDATDNDQVMSARTYGGAVEIYNTSSSSARGVEPTAGSINLSSTLTLTRTGSQGIVLDLDKNDPTFTVSSDVTINGGATLSASNTGALNIGGNYQNDGTFTANSGTVTLNGASAQVLGGSMIDSNKFYNLTVTNNGGTVTLSKEVQTGATFTAITAGSTIAFEFGSNYTFQNINMDGQAEGTRVQLSGSGTWNLIVLGTQNVSYVNVTNSNACSGDNIRAYDGTNYDNGGNSCWDFSNDITIRGQIFQSNEADYYDCKGDELTIGISVSGRATTTTTCTDPDGNYEFTAPGPYNAGDPIVVFIDSGETPQATTITRSGDPYTGITGLDIYDGRLIVRHDDDGPLTNADLASGDNGDAGIHYGVSSNNLTVESDFELHVWTGDTYDPGGTFTTQGASGDLHVDDVATGNVDSSTSTVSGDVVVDDGAALNGAASLIVNGGAMTGAGTVTFSSGTVTLNGTGDFGSDPADWSFSNLTLGSGSSEATTAAGGGGVTVSGVLTISSNQTLNAGAKTWTLSGTGTPLVISGTLAGDTSTFKYTGAGNTNITASANYNNLEILPGGNSVTHTLAAGTFTLTGNLTLGNGTYTSTTVTGGNNPTINVGGNLTVCASPCSNQMTYTKSSNLLNLKPSGTKTWTDNNPTKQDVGAVSIGSGSSTPKIQLATGVRATAVSVAASHELALNSKDLYITGHYSGASLYTDSGAVVSCAGCTGGTVTVPAGYAFGGGDGSESLTFYNLTFGGTGVLCFSNFTVMNTLTLPSSISAPNLITMTGTSGTIIGGGATITNLTINPSSTGTVTLSTSDLSISGTLNVAASDTLSLDSGRTMTLSSTGSLTLSGTISGAGRFTYRPSSAFPSGGAISSIVRFDAVSNDQIVGARTYGGAVEIYNTGGFDRTVTLGTIDDQTINFASSLNVTASSSGELELTASPWGPNVTIGGDLGFTAGASTKTITANKGTWTVSGNIDFDNGVFTPGSSTVKMNGASKSINPGTNSLWSFEVAGSNITAGKALDLNGSFVMSSGSFVHPADDDINVAGDFTIGAGTTFTKASGAGQLIFDGTTTYTDSTSPLQDVGNVTVSGTGSVLNLGSNMQTADLTVAADNSMYTHGYDVSSGSSTVFGSITINGTFDATNDVTNETLINLTFVFTINSGATFVQDHSTLTFNRVAAYGYGASLITDGSFSLYNLTVDGGGLTVVVSDPLDVDNDVTITTGALDTSALESNAVTVGGDWTNNGTFYARSGTVTLDGSSTQQLSGTLIGATGQFYNLTVTNASAGGVDFNASAQTANDFTVATADVNLTYEASATYTFQNINWDGQAVGTRVTMRSSSPSTQWNLIVSGTQTAVSYVDVQDSNACGGDTIDANDGTNVDSGNNNCWNFGIFVNGTVYSDDGTTPYDCSADNLTIDVSVNGGTAVSTTCTEASGVYSVAADSPGSVGQPVAVYIDSTETPQGTTVTLADGVSAGIAGADIYQNRVVVKNSNDWWDSNYDYRLPITITENSGSAQADYTVFYQFDHAAMVTASKSLATGYDVRIVDNNGTQIDRVLDYGSSWNGTTTTIAFKVASLPANSTRTYFMYYGNSSATSPTGYQDESDVYYFWDDFADGESTGWTAGTGTWTVASDSGNYVLSGTGDGFDHQTNVAYAADSLTSYVVKHTYRVNGGGGTLFPYFGTILRYEDSTHLIRLDQYTSGATSYIRLIKWDGGASACSSSTITAPGTTPHTIEITVDGNTYTADVDGINKINGATCTAGTIDAGNKGFFANYAGNIYFDNYSIRKYTASEPTVAGANEQAYTSGLAQITNADLAAADNTEAGIRYAVSGGNLTTDSGMELHVWTGGTYDPGGTFTTQGAGGDLHLDDNATAYVDTNSSVVSEDITVATGATLSLDAGRTLTLTTGKALTLDGTISGDGMFIYQSATAFPTSGTISADLRFDATDNNQTMSARTYGGLVEVYNNSAASARTVTMAAGTHTFLFDLNLRADNTRGITLAGATNNPAVGITGNIDYTGSGDGTEAMTSGTGTWTIAGNIDFTGGTFTATPNNLFSFQGTSNVTSAGQSFYNITSDSGAIITLDAMDVDGYFSLNDAVFIQAANGNLSVADNFDLLGGTAFTKASGSGVLILNGSMTYTDSTSPLQDVGDVQVEKSALVDLASDMKASSLNISDASTVRQDNHNIDIGGDITLNNGQLWPANAENINLEGSLNLETGSLLNMGSGTITFDGGSGTVNIVTASDCTQCWLGNVVINDGGGSLVVEVEDPLEINGNITITNGTLDVISGENNQINVSGNWTNSDTFVSRQGTVVFDAASIGHTINPGLSSFYNLTFNNSDGAWSPLTNTVTVTNNLTLTNGTFDTSNGTADVMVNGQVLCSSGTINMSSTNTFTQSVSATKSFQECNIAWTFYNLIFHSSGGTPMIDRRSNGIAHVLNDLSVLGDEDSLELNDQLSSGAFDVDGDVTIDGNGTFSLSGNSNMYVGGNWTNNGDVNSIAGMAVVLDGTSQQTLSGTLTGADGRFNGLTIANAGVANPDVIFAASAETTSTFTANTASSQIQFLAGGTYTFQNIDFDGQAENTRVALRSSSTGTQWNINVAGTRSVSNTDVRDSYACGQPPDIDATDGTNFNATNNNCWLFNTLTFSISDKVIGFGSLATSAARWATGDGNGTGSQPAVGSGAHQLDISSNADGGYALTYYGENLASISDSITAATISGDGDGTPGTKQFALAASSETGATIPLAYRYAVNNYSFTPTSTETLATNSSSVVSDIIYAYYICNISVTTNPGDYSTNITYIVTATF